MSTVKGFTLIELLIVIGILAILATTVVLVLNPAQILQETRDTQRISDLSSVQSAIGLYLATAASIDMDDAFLGATGCGQDWWASLSAVPLASQPFANPAVTEASKVIAASSIRDVDGDGWVPIDFTGVSGGSPLAGLPQDPSSTATGANAPLSTTGHFYAYQCVNTGSPAYEINANMESGKFSNVGGVGGASDVEGTDGGNQAAIFEVGNSPGLSL